MAGSDKMDKGRVSLPLKDRSEQRQGSPADWPVLQVTGGCQGASFFCFWNRKTLEETHTDTEWNLHRVLSQRVM